MSRLDVSFRVDPVLLRAVLAAGSGRIPRVVRGIICKVAALAPSTQLGEFCAPRIVIKMADREDYLGSRDRMRFTILGPAVWIGG